MMAYASTDVTYCRNHKCERKCWRYEGNFRFDKDKYYHYMNKCNREVK